MTDIVDFIGTEYPGIDINVGDSISFILGASELIDDSFPSFKEGFLGNILIGVNLDLMASVMAEYVTSPLYEEYSKPLLIPHKWPDDDYDFVKYLDKDGFNRWLHVIWMKHCSKEFAEKMARCRYYKFGIDGDWHECISKINLVTAQVSIFRDLEDNAEFELYKAIRLPKNSPLLKEFHDRYSMLKRIVRGKNKVEEHRNVGRGMTTPIILMGFGEI